MHTTHKRIWLWLATLIVISWGMCCHQAALAEHGDQQSFKAALLLPRRVDSDGWTKAGYAGLLLIEKELQAEIAYTESVPEAEFEQVFRQYAQDGFDFIIGHGGQFVPAAEIVAEEFSRTKFAVVTKYAGNNKNLGGLSLRGGELGYLAGVVAALKTKTNKIAYIGGVPHPGGREIGNLFERGAKDTNSAITVSIEWVNSWTDQNKAREIAQKQIEAGTDILFTIASGTSVVIHKIAEKAGVHTIGWIEDLHDLAPNTILTTGIQDIPRLLLKGAKLVRQGHWEGKQYKFGLREGVQYLTPFRGMLSKEQEEQVQAVQHDIIQGKIDLTL